MRLCHACLEEKAEDEFYNRKYRNSINNRCIRCERGRRKVDLIFDKSSRRKIELMEIERNRFFVCNVKYCKVHGKYHPISFFETRIDRPDGYRSYCREVRKERKRAQRQNRVKMYTNIQNIICRTW